MVSTNFAIKVYNINLVSFGLESGRYDNTDEMNSGSKLPIRLCPKSAKIKKIEAGPSREIWGPGAKFDLRGLEILYCSSTKR